MFSHAGKKPTESCSRALWVPHVVSFINDQNVKQAITLDRFLQKLGELVYWPTSSLVLRPGADGLHTANYSKPIDGCCAAFQCLDKITSIANARINSELLSKFALPLFAENLWAHHDESVVFETSRQFVPDQPRFNRFTQTNFVGDEKVARR